MKFIFFKPFASRRKVMAGLVLAVAILLPCRAMSAETRTLSVKMANTPLFSEPSMDSAKTAVAQAGDLLELVEEAGRFYKVRTPNGETGYVPRMNVTESKPAQAVMEKEDVGLDDVVGGLGEQQAFKLDEGSSSHSVRGKVSAKPLPVITPMEAEKSALEMESLTITPEEIMEFAKEGGLE